MSAISRARASVEVSLPPSILSQKKMGGVIVWMFRCQCGRKSFCRPHLYEQRKSLGLKCVECAPKNTKTCEIEGCEEKHVSRGYCRYHYNAWKRLGDPLAIGQQNERSMLGVKFGSLTVIRHDGYDEYGHKRWLCRCDCGRTLHAHGPRLKNGKTKRCTTCNERSRSTTTDLTGEKFGRLTVIGRHDDVSVKTKVSVWRCQCGCGKLVMVKRSALTSGSTLSCGCYKQSVITIEEGLAAKRVVYRSYKDGARARDLDFNLNFDDFVKMAEQDCHYCGVAPYKSIKSTKKGRSMNGDFIHNGIDRVDSDLGYFLDNCVPACWDCNHAKRDKPYDHFMEWIGRLVNKHADQR